MAEARADAILSRGSGGYFSPPSYGGGDKSVAADHAPLFTQSGPTDLYPCFYCEKCFSQKADLEAHSCYDQGLAQYDCPITGCDRMGPGGFAEEGHLVNHLRYYHMMMMIPRHRLRLRALHGEASTQLAPRSHTRSEASKPYPLSEFLDSRLPLSPLMGSPTITIEAFCELESFVRHRLSPGQRLGSVLTLTGSTVDAQATTCEEYISSTWPGVGADFLSAMERAMGLPVSNMGVDTRKKIDISVRLKQGTAYTAEYPLSPITVEVKGPFSAQVEVAEALAWISTAIRISNGQGPSSSEVTISHRVGAGSNNTEYFDLRLGKLRPIDSSQQMCWHPLFAHGIIAAGFPIRGRRQGRGLEIASQTMSYLAGAASPTGYNNGLVLEGSSTILVPTKLLEDDRAMQWRLIWTSGQGRTSAQLIEEKCPGWLRVGDLAGALSQRAFLG
ncbi:hypothetical protein FGG08_006123 [Glutinoglossum americanum]|uniref:C2H2-type domain-containing protein n=1 Tax=Glutinoglossum americanum TaxID=1670608 RepID=A0A9P8L0Q8_9PEZI|nr:hypothetical protein FGG08_006123 [Glutinoglossum americanum]